MVIEVNTAINEYIISCGIGLRAESSYTFLIYVQAHERSLCQRWHTNQLKELYVNVKFLDFFVCDTICLVCCRFHNPATFAFQ